MHDAPDQMEYTPTRPCSALPRARFRGCRVLEALGGLDMAGETLAITGHLPQTAAESTTARLKPCYNFCINLCV